MAPQERFGKAGYTMTPHSYWTILPKKVSGMAQFHAIGYIMDRTFGAKGNPTWATISCTQLARISGMSAKAFSLVLDDAVSRGLLERKEDGRGFAYRAWPEAWAAIADYEPAVVEKEAPAEPETAAAAELAETSAPANSSEVTVEAGKSARPIILSIAIKDSPSPVDLKLQTRNETGLPLVFRTAISATGQVNLTVLSGEGKANRPGSALHSPALAFDKNQQLTAYKSYLNVICVKRFGKAPDPAFVSRVVKAAGSATIDQFTGIVEERLSRRGHHKMGLLIDLAADAAALANASQAIERQQLKSNPPAAEVDRAEFLRGEYERFQADPEFAELIRNQAPDFFAEVMGTATTAE